VPTFVSDDAVTLRYHHEPSERSGSTPVLVVPGGPCRGVEYLAGLAETTGGRDLVVLHPRGTPTTGGLSRGWWRDAADVVALADHLGLAEVDVLAHSAGTRLALAAAVQHSARVRSLLLVTPPATWLTGTADDGEQLARARHDPLVDAAVDSLLGPPPADDDEFQRRWMVEAPAGYARWGEAERAHAGLGAVSLPAARAWFRDVPPDAADRVRAGVRSPVLVVGGAADAMTGVAPVESYAAALGADLVMLPDCGHYPWVEQPAALSAAVAPWLRRT